MDFNGKTDRDRLGSAGKKGLAFILLKATNGCCAICGDALIVGAGAKAAKRFEICHLIPASFFSSPRGGFVSGNLFAGCRSCNVKCEDKDMRSAIVEFEIPEGIVEWTDYEVGKIGRNLPAEKEDYSDHADKWARINALV